MGYENTQVNQFSMRDPKKLSPAECTDDELFELHGVYTIPSRLITLIFFLVCWAFPPLFIAFGIWYIYSFRHFFKMIKVSREINRRYAAGTWNPSQLQG
ncbi:MAG: hypothetical protein INQ03_16505 [Candidatus Heimdallarchaeota archaeon]|nr:hypothetical protein [Candidatus Heimdallarchaeota archaeon]